MKRFFYIAILFPLLANAQMGDLKFNSEFEQQAFAIIDSSQQPKDILRLFFAADSTISEANFESTYSDILAFNEAHKLNKNPRHLFDETQNNFFTEYALNPSIANLINDSTYSCVTGSALIGFYLEINGFDYTIQEMPYHVFLTVEHRNRNYILETTDTEYGFLPDIKVNRRSYLPDTIDNSYIFKEIGDYSNLKDGQIVVKGNVTLLELAGLSYYNTAINCINSKDYTNAVYQLQKAYYLYPSLRIKEAAKYSLIQVLNDPELSKEEKIPFYEMLASLTFSYSTK
jgi:hypothetical protein